MDILLVDDNPTNLKLLRVTLEAEGLTVFLANDGVEALELLQTVKIDAVISDILMPRMDGYRLCFEVRTHKRLSRLPFIIYSATYTSPGDEKLSLDMGADLYLRKPSPPKAIVEALQKVVQSAPHAEHKTILPPEELGLMKEYNERLVKKLEHKNASLETTHAELNQLLAHSPAVIYKLRSEGGTLIPSVVSSNIERFLGVPVEEASHPAWWKNSLHEDDRDRVVREFAAGTAKGGHRMEYRLRHKDGEFRWVEDNCRLIRHDSGLQTEAVGVWSDITERKEAEEALKESESRYKTAAGQLSNLIDASLDVICTIDAEGRFLRINAACLPVLGYTPEELLGTLYIEKVLPEDLDKTNEESVAIMAGRSTRSFENRYVKKNGSTASIQWSASWSEADQVISCVARDVTEHKKLEQQFFRAQRMESIGTLAGGIAHDLNNVLTPIMMSIALLKRNEEDPQRLSILSTIESSTKRGADMVGQVLSFASGVQGRQLEVDLAPLLREVEKITNETFLKNVRVNTEIPEGLWSVQGDTTQLHQVLINLCVNARDAMPDGGVLTLTAANVRLDEHYAAMNLEVKAGPYVLIKVEDTGSGMSQAVIERIFEPFFTTKGLGKGTGLGLSTTIAIVKSHGGFVRVYSEPGQGTRFLIYLPAHDRVDGRIPSIEVDELPRGNGELVLVVDDEAAVRQITRQTLEAFGYQVLLAGDGAEATALYATRKMDIALVLTDMMMPVMDGPAMIQVLVRINPKVRIIAASGLNANGMVAKAANAGVKHFLPKPYTAETLLTKLRHILLEPV